MTFAPIVPVGGYAGWRFLQRTLERQEAAFTAVSANQRDEGYFRDRIGTIDSAAELVADRRLLGVALGAYGLEGDINNRYFIQRVLSDGTLKEGALANRLADKQYQKLSADFGFGDFATPRSKDSAFADKILASYRARQFEVAVGEQNPDLRLALNARRELPALAAKGGSEDTLWFTVMGSPPLRGVVEKALGLPSRFAAIDLDQQLSTLKEKTRAAFGSDSVRQFKDPDQLEKLIRNFLVRSEAASILTAASGGAIALQLLQA